LILTFNILAILIKPGIRFAPINYNMQVNKYNNKVGNIIIKVLTVIIITIIL
jgi:hypothetical protein